ncbi:MAG: hypothetical protein E3J70_08070 [Candidatus Heimdallarchaeota archaeon]|nr:MAG: hypothetical protein E3J70_08070 [Candidatus Heimdallarchaeota archaeon]
MNASDDNDLKTEDTTSPSIIELTPHELEPISKKKESKVLSTLRQIFRALFSWEAIHLMLSHHPFCEVYDPHVFKIGKLRLCRGCFLSYPPLYALVTIFIFWEAAREFFLLEAISIIDNLWWFVIGFGILTFVARWLGRFSIFIKDIAKFSRGTWTGLLVMVIISQHWGFKLGAALIVFGGMTYLSLHRGKDMERTCNECEWNADFNACPGWEGISEKLFQTTTSITESIPPENPELEKQDTK